MIENDLTITMATESGQFQLNAMEPIVVFKILESIRIITNALETLGTSCVEGIQANEEQCASLLNSSLVNSVLLVDALGYDLAAHISKTAGAEGCLLGEISLRKGLLEKLPTELRQDFVVN